MNATQRITDRSDVRSDVRSDDRSDDRGDVRTADELRRLTAERARCCREAGGPIAVLGGVLCLLAALAGGLLSATPWLRLVLTALPLVWIAVKELAARSCLDRLSEPAPTEFDPHEPQSRATQPPGQAELREQWLHRARVAFTAAIAAGVVLGVLSQAEPFGRLTPDLRMAGYLGVVATLPLVVWRWLRNAVDFVVGVFLICVAALAVAGVGWPVSAGLLVGAPFALGVAGYGVHAHRRLRELESRIAQLTEERSDASMDHDETIPMTSGAPRAARDAP